MTEDDLTCEQAKVLYEQVGECLRYMGRLRERMERTHWDPQDRLYVLVKETYNKLHHLNSRCYSLSVPQGNEQAAEDALDLICFGVCSNFPDRFPINVGNKNANGDSDQQHAEHDAADKPRNIAASANQTHTI